MSSSFEATYHEDVMPGPVPEGGWIANVPLRTVAAGATIGVVLSHRPYWFTVGSRNDAADDADLVVGMTVAAAVADHGTPVAAGDSFTHTKCGAVRTVGVKNGGAVNASVYVTICYSRHRVHGPELTVANGFPELDDLVTTAIVPGVE